ncbi:hypothetical protein BDZ89DRAFT_1055637 [Hymenopellis radicata]|nr:hypothetical protein BDZ89DRAFT_1055637 [Hymenopellis radicata]
MSTRPGPLKPWAVEQFYPELVGLPPPQAPLKTPSRPNKRPHSSSETPFSPTKRRLLNDAGIYCPSKAALFGAPPSPARFATPLHGPSSPAKRLDFGIVKSGVELFPTPTGATASASKLAPSPRLSASPDDEDSPFKAPLPPMPFADEPVTPSNRSSVHYPGFVVHEDKHPHLAKLPTPPRFKGGDEASKENRPPAEVLQDMSFVFSSDPKTAELQRKHMLKLKAGMLASPVPVETPTKSETPTKKETPKKKKSNSRKRSCARAESATPTERRYNTRAATKEAAEAKRRIQEALKADGAGMY